MIQHPELDGPFTVATDPNRWNTTPRFFAAHQTALTPYRVQTAPLSRVWCGDDPAAPKSTVALAFPDAATAATVLLACGAV